MKELVLELVDSYQSRVSAVEALVTSSYQVTAASEGRFGVLDEERGKLKVALQDSLARNCSLRKKDFDCLMEGAFADSARKRRAIEEERRSVMARIKACLDEQKALTVSLRQQLGDLGQDVAAQGSLDAIIARLRATCGGTERQLLAMLDEFQSHLSSLQAEEQEMNCRLQMLADRGESLRTEDLSQIGAARVRQDRIAQRALRRKDVEGLLAHFKQERESWRCREKQPTGVEKGG